MDSPIFAFDFSMNKPAMCSYINSTLEFFVWPSAIDTKSSEKLRDCDINITNRNLPPITSQGLNEHELILDHLKRSVDLGNIIADTIENSLSKHNITDKSNIIISNEGFAFSANGNAALDLSGYKYILLYILYQRGFRNFRTYSPITIKKTAGCSKRGLGKDDMIKAVSEQNIDKHKFIKTLHDCPEELKKKTAFVLCTDDLADSYWCLRTTLNDLKIETDL